MLFWSKEEKDARAAVKDLGKRCREKRWRDLEWTARELERLYDSVLSTRRTIVDAREDLAYLIAKNKEMEILGEQVADLKGKKDDLHKAEALLKARQEQLRVLERQAKRKYPSYFRFL